MHECLVKRVDGVKGGIGVLRIEVDGGETVWRVPVVECRNAPGVFGANNHEYESQTSDVQPGSMLCGDMNAAVRDFLNDELTTKVGYKLTRDGFGTWMYCGVTVDEVIAALRVELESDCEPGNERSSLTLSPFEITQRQIDNMPEFPGW